MKTGISHPRLRPTLAVVDPLLTMSQPAGVTAAAGMDILCHALESWTARPYTSYDRKQPEQRVPYCGANPVADMWAEKAMTLLAASFRRAVRHGDDEEAREQMALAATFAGHGLRQRGRAHPARQRVPDRRPGPGLPPGGLPRGRADGAARDGGVPDRAGGVPVHVRRRAGAPPPGGRRCWRAGADRPRDDRDLLPEVLRTLMRDIEIPNGLGAVGYAEGDVDDLVEGAVKQQRLLATAPKDVTEDDLARSSAVRSSCGDPAASTGDRRRTSWRALRAQGIARRRRLRAGADALLLRRLDLPRPAAGRGAARGTPTSSPRCWRWPGRPASPLTMRGAGTSIAGNAVGAGHRRRHLAAPGPGARRSTPRRGPPSSSPAPCTPPSSGEPCGTGCGSAPTRRPTPGARSAG